MFRVAANLKVNDGLIGGTATPRAATLCER
jgi:hypothetical protein